MANSHLVLIPSYNSGPKLLETVQAALQAWEPVWVVLDGCTDGSADALKALLPTQPALRILELADNQGKGAAVLAGLRAAQTAGFQYALVMDADGQHPAERIPQMMDLSRRHPSALILGVPEFGPGAPASRKYGRRVGNWWANLETLWGGIEDSLFGFRVYPIPASLEVLESITGGRRYDFDTQLVVRLYWRGWHPVNVRVPVRYPSSAEGGVTHFRLLWDNLLLIKVHAGLVFGMVARLPELWRKRKVSRPKSKVQSPRSKVQSPKSKVQSPKSRDQSLESNGQSHQSASPTLDFGLWTLDSTPGALDYRIRFTLLCGLSILPLAAIAAAPARWAWCLCLHLVFQGLLLYGNLRPGCAWFGRVVRAFRTDHKEVWLTIDDGPHPARTPAVLELLDRFNVRATFFVVGDRARAHPELLQAILQRGHTLGNHSASHPAAWFWAYAGRAVAREIDGGADAIAAVTGAAPVGFRAPVGMANYFVRAALRRRRIPLIGWSARGFDTVSRDPDLILRRLWHHMCPGSIILLHEPQPDPRGRPPGPSALERVLSRLQHEGYACVLPEPEQWR